MKVNIKVKDGYQINAFYLFYILVNIQTGTGIMGAPRYIYEHAKQDAWISVIIATLFIHMLIFVMFRTLRKYDNADIFGIQEDVFGKWLGRLIGTIIIIYLTATLLSVLINYIQVVQYFIYPILKPWLLAILLIVLVIYTVLKGLRVIVGVAFVFFWATLYLVFFLYWPLTQLDINHFRPVLEASPLDLLKGAKTTSYSFIGLEVLFFIYPFIDNKKKAQFPTQLGVGMTGLFIFIVTVLSIGYFGGERLAETFWPVLILYKVISFPVIERIDLIVVCGWMMAVLPVMILLTWMITFGLKRMYNLQQKSTLYAVCFIILIGSIFIKEQMIINRFIDYISQAGFWIAFIYPFLLYPLVLIKKKFSKKKEGKS